MSSLQINDTGFASMKAVYALYNDLLNRVITLSGQVAAGGDIKSDGSVPFAQAETFEMGLVISGGQLNATAGFTMNSSGGPFGVLAEAGQLCFFHCVSAMTWGDVFGSGNSTKMVIDDSAEQIALSAVHLWTNMQGYANDAAAGVAGLTTGDLWYETGTRAVFVKS